MVLSNYGIDMLLRNIGVLFVFDLKNEVLV